MKILKRLTLIAIIIVCAYFINTSLNERIFVSKFSVVSEELPDAFDGYRIIHLSDIHSVRSQEQQERILNCVKQEHPDLIVMTGDLVDSDYYTESSIAVELKKEENQLNGVDEGTLIPDELTLQLMKELLDIAPVYWIYGNHEMVLLDDPVNNPLKKAIEDAGVVLLNHERVQLEKNGESMWLLGVQDPIVLYKDELFADSGSNNEERLKAELDYVTQDIKDEEFAILLSHRPEYFELYTEYPVDLALTGHAHGGQIRLPFIGGLYAPGQGFFPKYTSGVFETENFKMVVSRGIGDSKNLTRVFNPPEIISITLSR